jgi:hypothetical protein
MVNASIYKIFANPWMPYVHQSVTKAWRVDFCGLDLRIADPKGKFHETIFDVYNSIYFNVNDGIYKNEVVD